MKHIKLYESFLDKLENLPEKKEFKHKPFYAADFSGLKSYLNKLGLKYFTPEEVSGIFELKYATFLKYNGVLEVYHGSAEEVTANGGDYIKYKPDEYRDFTSVHMSEVLLVVVGNDKNDSYRAVRNYLNDNPIKVVPRRSMGVQL
jgi:hypothetical protein